MLGEGVILGLQNVNQVYQNVERRNSGVIIISILKLYWTGELLRS